jgi:polyhydroxybutyrate depolymerase
MVMRPTRLFYKNTLSLMMLGVMLAACAKPSAHDILNTTFKGLNAEHHCVNWQGVERCYYAVIPETSAPKSLLIALHPAFHDVPKFESMAHMVHQVAAHDIVALYPEGIARHWNDGRHAERTKTFRDGSDDVGFLSHIIQMNQDRFGITVSRTTLAGMSNGGMMALRMACQSDVVGRLLAVTANLPIGAMQSCNPKNLTRVNLVFGTKDKIVPYRGGKLGLSKTDWGAVVSATATERHFAGLLRCEGSYQQYRLNADSGDGTIIHKRDFYCKNSTMHNYHIEGMGHTWPSEENYLQAFLTRRGRITQELDANQMLLDITLAR